MKTHVVLLALALVAGALPVRAAGDASDPNSPNNPTNKAVNQTNEKANKADAKWIKERNKVEKSTKTGAKKAGNKTGNALHKSGKWIDQEGRKLEGKTK